MKNIERKLLLFALFSFTIMFSYAQSASYEIRTHVNDIGYIEVQMRETTGGSNLPSHTDGDLIGDIAYAIRWPSSLGTDIAFLCSSNDYNMRDPSGVVHTDVSGWNYRYYTADNTPFLVPTDWAVNQWVTISIYKVTTGSGTNGSFEIAPQNFGISTLDWAIAEGGTPPYIQYTPTINGSISNYSYPTLVYTFVWKGGLTSHGHDYTKIWEFGANWQDECSNDRSGDDYPYQGTENVYIPDVSGASGAYPEQTGNWNDGWNINNMLIAANAHVTVPDLSGNTYTHLSIAGDLKVKGKLYLPALGYATVTGSTEIDNAEGIEVQAGGTGVGSFIDNGTITYGSSGSGKVQTYLTNAAGSGNLYIHTVGPTVDIGGAGGAHLSDFNLVNGSTYAYSWDESQPATTGWQNISSLSYLVATADGIALSTTDNTAHTLNMTGAFITGNTQSPALTHSNNDDELISNPYPSSIDFDAFATDASNSSVISNKYWIWDPLGGSYITRASSSGGQQYIQVGQAFFVETKTAGNVTFKNSFRAHSNDAFRSTNPNELTMKVSGGDYGYKDELVVRFLEEGATYGYDPEIDAYKMNSMYDDATQIESIAEDSSELAINFLPLSGLSGDMVSVPVHFKCGYNGDYTFDFEGIETFENQNEIWLEDKANNDSWIYLNDNPHYTFTATSYEPQDRFILHFFGPTSVNEHIAYAVKIYSYRQYAYVKNNTHNEVIKKISVYNLNGEEMFSKRVPDQPITKLWISNQVGYYLVRVITDKNSYTGKVFIFK